MKPKLKRFRLSIVLAAAATCGPAAFCGGHDVGTTIDDRPVNAMCPIGKEPIVPSAGTVDYKGHVIGLCCPGCGKAFLAWNETRRDEFVALALSGTEPGQDAHSDPDADPDPPAGSAAPVPYTLGTCIVTGAKLGSMGDPVIREYDGREVRFCCASCIEAFEADRDAYFGKIDELIIEDQMRYYPIDRCVVSGEPLVEAEDGTGGPVDFVYAGRLVRLSSEESRRTFDKTPTAFIDALDEAVAAAQREDYPLEKCIVADGALGSMGEPTEMVLAGRLMRFCCAACEPRVIADPATYLARIDEAWQAAGRFTPARDAPRDGDHGEPGSDR